MGQAQLTDALRNDIERAEHAMELGQLSEAARRSSGLVRQLPANLRVRQLHAAALAGGEDALEHVLALHRLHSLRDDADVRRLERIAAGQIVVTSPGWLPRLPAPPESMPAPGAHVVLFLAEESGPASKSPATDRLRARLAALQDSAFRPEVVTALGFPRSAGVTDVPSIEIHDGIPHHRLDLGAFYPLDTPADRRLRDGAWLAAAVVARVRPAVIHALFDGNRLDSPFIGAALSRHFGAPIIVEVVTDPGTATTGDAERLHRAAMAAMGTVDHVITADTRDRDRLVARGLDATQVTVVGAAGSSPEPGAGIADIYANVLAGRAAGSRA